MLNLGSYQQTKQIYSGTHTIVYRAIQATQGQPVIIKVLRNHHPTFNELVQFRNQYIITRNLQHSAIVKPLALERYENSYALVMLDDGAISLSDYWPKSNPSLTEFLAIAIQLASALHYLTQQRIIHKDIKPANILIHPETKQIKLIDFSISSLLPTEKQQIINPNILEGTLGYISPEQTGRMNRGIDYRTDFYSLGVTFFELLSGKLPFTTTDPMKLLHSHIAQPAKFSQESQIPEVLQNIVLKLMAKNAEDRYQSALGLKCDLEKCQQQLETTGKITLFELGERDQSDRFIIPEKLYGREIEVQTILNAFDRVANPHTLSKEGEESPPTPIQTKSEATSGLPLSKGDGRGIKKEGEGRVEMMLVAGVSGIGKTAVVNEIHKPIVRQQGYFIKGKYDQFQRNIPFSAFVQAFRDLVKQLLSESDAELANWKSKILNALGENAQVIIDVVPELEKIIGTQPAAQELSGSAAQNRFNLLFQKFIAVFTAPSHPVVMFLDDLQWADSVSLNLIKVLMSNTEIEYLLILGAYRDNEVFPAHPLMLSLAELEKNQAVISTIKLQPLALSHINQLIADTLNCSQQLALPLSELVYQKTQGNSFFTTQFLKGLQADGLIKFNQLLGYWECDLVKVRDAVITDDVVEFMARRLQKFSAQTQKVLKLAACIGNQFDLETLAVVCEKSDEEVAEDIWSALQEGLILPISQTYKFFQGGVEEKTAQTAQMVRVGYRFLHDRVQQATYSLIPEEEKQATHWKIGQLLLQNTLVENIENKIFEIVNQLNIGLELIIHKLQRRELAQLNFIAGKKAKIATAYTSAFEYSQIARNLLLENHWQKDYEFALSIYELVAETAYLSSNIATAETIVNILFEQARDVLDKVKACEVKIQILISKNQLLEAIQIGLNFLAFLGIDLPEKPDKNDVKREENEIKQKLYCKRIESFIYLPIMKEKKQLASMRILSSLFNAAYLGMPKLLPLIVAKQVDLSITYGNMDVSPSAYANYALILCSTVDNIDLGYCFGNLALNLLNIIESKEFYAKTIEIVCLSVKHWKEHINSTLKLLIDGYTIGLESGDFESASFAAYDYCAHSFVLGKNLIELEREMFNYGLVIEGLQQKMVFNLNALHRQAVLNLIETNNHPSFLQGKAYDQEKMLPIHQQDNDFSSLALFYIDKLFLCYLFDDRLQATEIGDRVEFYLEGIPGQVFVPIFYLYDALSWLSLYPGLEKTEQEIAMVRISSHQTKMTKWAELAPMNYAHKLYLINAEKRRVLGEKIGAIEMYDLAIALAQENNYLQEEALANELAAKFYLEWGKEKFAAIYMEQAYYCYASWGAKAKINQLEKQYPQLLTPILKPQPLEFNRFENWENFTQTLSSTTIQEQTSTSTKLSETLDLASILQATQAISSTIELDQLLSKVVEIILTNAGAQKTALLTFPADKWQIQAIAEVATDGTVKTSIKSFPVDIESIVPTRLIQYVKNTQESILINEYQTDIVGIMEGYLLKYQPQSILCVPLLYQGNLVGILYLEHPTTKGVFTSYRQSIVQSLCTQAAISLQNAQLYEQATQALQDLQQAQLQIVQSEKMSALGNLMAGVAHEINNPTGFLEGNIYPAEEYVQDLLGLIDLYQSEYPQPNEVIAEEIEAIELEFIREDLPKLLGSMNAGVERIRNISNSLRTFARKDQEHKTVFNIHEGIDSTLLILKHRTKANQQRPGIDIVRNYGDIPQVECFPGQLNQVLMNILANAIDTFDEASLGKTYAEIETNPNRITIETSMVGENQIHIKIEDNGGGMKPEIKNRIFEQGFTTKEVGKGTGLGMAIAHQIITEKHGGTIVCDSTVAKGTIFTISLPIEE